MNILIASRKMNHYVDSLNPAAVQAQKLRTIGFLLIATIFTFSGWF